MELNSDLENDDWKLANKLRNEDPEQFYTLVRMHLSFVLDLNTDDCEWPVEKAKLRNVLKWSLAPFSKKPRQVLIKNNCDSKGILTKDSIAQVFQLVEFLSKEDNATQEGIFRRSGKMTRQQELKSQLTSGTPLDLDNSQFSVHDCASVLKTFLAELSEPLLTEAYYPAYCQIAELCLSESTSESRLQCALQLLLLLLPSENWTVLKNVLNMLQLISTYEAHNKMNADNLATLFTPHLLCPRKLTPEAFHSSSQMLSHVVSFMIRSGSELFQVPPRLATDIFAYWERRKMSPKIEVNNGGAASTVFSFVDRERTAQENTTNPTEAALAQLYAHIQSLPESSKKRRLIKQFNKENGFGTPRQNNRATSLGDSIKKRIFSKSYKQSKPLIESNILKCGRSSSEEMLDNSDECPKIVVQVEPAALEANDFDNFKRPISSEINVAKLEVSPDEDGNEVRFKEVEIDVGLVSGEKSVETPENLLISSPNLVESTPVRSVMFCTPTMNDVEKYGRGCMDSNKVTFYTPATTPATLRHKYWSVSRPSVSTPTKPNLANSTCLLTSTPAGAAVCNTNCLLTPSPMILSASADEMSPITRSTRRMTRAMQETMMTPRSRKPVVALSGSNISQLSSVAWGGGVGGSGERLKPCSEESSSSGLTSPFRDYLHGRSVLTASPVDLSFSSRTGDFDPSTFSDDTLPSMLSDSLLRCLDGEPVSASSTTSSASSSSSSKYKRKNSGGQLNDSESHDRVLRKRPSLTDGSITDNSRDGVFETSL
ncbi:rho GTPase-activating protein 19 [Nilaparvata lugens]|uniref:rho GTPase-activating protein 19 n=1 Tax=Nilaparvata lugens TaxID=108931 RepID=UPI00193C8F1C|nr:rho GTPase-activating protein 19 [Nilaparvata lugens]